jgi:hypothetical protein
MRLRRAIAQATALAAISGGLAVAAPASAALATNAPPKPVQLSASTAERQLDALEQRNPGSHRIDARSLEIGPGAIITAAPFGPPSGCNYGDLCVYSEAKDAFPPRGGWYLHFTNCGEEWNLGNIDFPEGGKWNDRISAIYNHQTPNTMSYFYNYRGWGGFWDQVLFVNAGDYRLNLARDGVNDIIDGVHVCGQFQDPWTPNR